jgi:hypothetical protein
MDLRQYGENIQRQLAAAAEAGGDDARALAERLVGPLDAAIRLALQDSLAEAVEEITCELAPGSVELRLRGRDLDFVVKPAGGEPSTAAARAPDSATGGSTLGVADGDDGAMARINVRMPEHLKIRIEQSAATEGLSVNAWLIRAANRALEPTDPGRPSVRPLLGGQRYTGWAR